MTQKYFRPTGPDIFTQFTQQQFNIQALIKYMIQLVASYSHTHIIFFESLITIKLYAATAANQYFSIVIGNELSYNVGTSPWIFK